jgi:hypothetical protein
MTKLEISFKVAKQCRFIQHCLLSSLCYVSWPRKVCSGEGAICVNQKGMFHGYYDACRPLLHPCNIKGKKEMNSLCDKKCCLHFGLIGKKEMNSAKVINYFRTVHARLNFSACMA